MLVDVYGSRRRGQFLGGHCRVKLQIEKTDHHFIPALLPPYHRFGGIGIVRIVGRIVEMRGAFDLGALRQRNGIGKVVPQLPMPVINRHAQNRFTTAVGENQSVVERFSARVHVRMQSHQRDVFAHLKGGVDFVIRVAGGILIAHELNQLQKKTKTDDNATSRNYQIA